LTLGATDLIEGGKQVALWLAVAVTLLDDRPRRRERSRRSASMLQIGVRGPS